MKKLFAFILLFCIALLYCVDSFAGNRYVVRRNSGQAISYSNVSGGGGIQLPNFSTVHPTGDDTLILTGSTPFDGIGLRNVLGTSWEHPVYIMNDDVNYQVVVGSDNTGINQSFLVTGKYIKILGNGSSTLNAAGIKGLRFRGGASGGDTTTTCIKLTDPSATGSFDNATHIEIAYCQMGREASDGAASWVSKAIFNSSQTGNDVDSIFCHNNYFHNIGWPTTNTGALSEVFYLGYSFITDPNANPRFTNIRVYNNICDTVAGDFVQVKNGTAEVWGNTCNYWGYNRFGGQGDGVQAGEFMEINIHNNVFSNGKGRVFFSKGFGMTRFRRNYVYDTKLLPSGDGACFYFNGDGFSGFPNMYIEFDSNVIVRCYAFSYLIQNITANADHDASFWRYNCFEDIDTVASGYDFMQKQSDDDTTNIRACFDSTQPPVGPTTPKKQRFKRWKLRYAYYSPSPQRMYANKPKHYDEEDCTEYSA